MRVHPNFNRIMRMFISNIFFLFIDTNRVICYTIKTFRNIFNFSTIFSSSNLIFRCKPSTNTSMRVFITSTGDTFNVVIYFFTLSMQSNIRNKSNFFSLHNKLSIYIKFIVWIIFKFLFPFSKFIRTKYIF